MGNVEYLLTRPGIFKLATIIIGIVAVSLGTQAHFESPYTDKEEEHDKHDNGTSVVPDTHLETFFVSTSMSCLILSSIYLVIYAIVDELVDTDTPAYRINRLFDMVFHGISALIIFCAGVGIIYSSAEIQNEGCRILGLTGRNSKVLNTISQSSYPSNSSNSGTLCHHYEEKLFAGIFGLVNGIVYGATSAVVYKSREL